MKTNIHCVKSNTQCVKTNTLKWFSSCAGSATLLAFIYLPTASAQGPVGGAYEIYVTNERSGDLTVIEGADFKVAATIPVGKRPRGIHSSPDGKTVYVALSGTPIQAPPQLDAHGNPILRKSGDDDDDNDVKSDKAADGIGYVDVAERKFLRKISAGSDPEEFALSADGKQLYVSNEDVGTASVFNVASGKVEHIIPVAREPEGAGTSPDGKTFYITCEAGGEVFAIDARSYKVLAHFTVNPRPRSIDFLPDGSRAFIPSESAAELNVVDTANFKVLQTIKLPESTRPMEVRLAPGGKTIYVSGGRSVPSLRSTHAPMRLSTRSKWAQGHGEWRYHRMGNTFSRRMDPPMTFPWWISAPRKRSHG